MSQISLADIHKLIELSHEDSNPDILRRIRNMVPTLLDIVTASLKWKTMQERKLSHLYELEEQALFATLDNVRW